jgi:BirA family biotin operon repressor/biotin-[acetyl-CoA-carboxylase] ligase
MMAHSADLAKYLDPLDLGAWRFYPTVGSTNDIALDWAERGAPDWALVVADAQTSGRGRSGRRWVTEPGHSLAISLVVRLSKDESLYFSRFTALGALGLIKALSGLGLAATLKWPNDVLLKGQKVAGVLVESDWQSGVAEAVVIGLGVNISPKSIPPAELLRYPATAIESVLGTSVDRWALLTEIILAMQEYRAIIGENTFVSHWNEHLAWRNDWVRFRIMEEEPQVVRVIGVRPDGRLSLETQDGNLIDALAGEILWGEDQP